MNTNLVPMAPIRSWLVEPMPEDVVEAISRLRRAPDVQHIAIMPDVHLAKDVCVGTVLATSTLLYPQAVGGDIGCGMLALRFDVSAETLNDPAMAGRVLAAIGQAVPTIRRPRRFVLPWPDQMRNLDLSHSSLESVRREEGVLQMGTLGSGNHFIELQADEVGLLWLMIHSGSRAMGQAIRDHHMARATQGKSGINHLDSQTEAGQAYLRDMQRARTYAAANRHAMAEHVMAIVADLLKGQPVHDSMISIDHNHVVSEVHFGRPMWIHRKGAMPAQTGMSGILPGSMGTESFHVEGRGCGQSLCSSAHGAGRTMSREVAKRSVSARDLHRQMQGVWFDYRMADGLRDEAPSAYKDIRAVLRAQWELVKIKRVLKPVLNYKGH